MAVVGVLLVMWVSCLGCGLALERVLRVRLANALLLPLGLCVALVVTFPGYAAGAGDALAVALLVVVTVAGLVFARDGAIARLNPGWPGLAGLAVYVLYMLPVILHGSWTWSGYDFVGDSSFEMLLAEHAKGFGTSLGNIPESSQREFLASYLGTGYPLGTQALLGTYSGLLATPVAVIYQGFIAVLAASAGVSLASLASRLLSARRAAVAAVIAVAANLTYQYALQGAIKELGLLATLCAAVALAREAIFLARPYVGAVLLAVATAAALLTYNAVAIPYLGALGVFVALSLVALARVKLDRRWLGPVLLGGALTLVLAIPILSTLQTFFKVAQTSQGATGVGATQFGQLLRALPLSQISGVWLAGEYRLPVVPEPRGDADRDRHRCDVRARARRAGVERLAARRRRGDAARRGRAGDARDLPARQPIRAGQAARDRRSGGGARRARRARRRARPSRAARAGAPGCLGAGVLASDLLAYSHDRVAPTARIEAITATGDHFRGQGPVLWNEFEEYAKYFARAAIISVPFEALTPQQVQLRRPRYFFGHYFDLDEELLSFVEGYPISSRAVHHRLAARRRTINWSTRTTTTSAGAAWLARGSSNTSRRSRPTRRARRSPAAHSAQRSPEHREAPS